MKKFSLIFLLLALLSITAALIFILTFGCRSPYVLPLLWSCLVYYIIYGLLELYERFFKGDIFILRRGRVLRFKFEEKPTEYVWEGEGRVLLYYKYYYTFEEARAKAIETFKK